MKRPNAPLPIHNARENWCRYNMKEIAVKHPNRFTKSILSGTRNTETRMEINLPTANEHQNKELTYAA